MSVCASYIVARRLYSVQVLLAAKLLLQVLLNVCAASRLVRAGARHVGDAEGSREEASFAKL